MKYLKTETQTGKSLTFFPPSHLIFRVATRNFKIQWYPRELELAKNWLGEKYFKLEKLKLPLPVTHLAGNNTELPSNSNILKTVRVNIVFTKIFFLKIDKLSNDIQVDRICTCGSSVIDVLSLRNYWNLKNRVFKFFRYWKG